MAKSIAAIAIGTIISAALTTTKYFGLSADKYLPLIGGGCALVAVTVLPFFVTPKTSSSSSNHKTPTALPRRFERLRFSVTVGVINC